MSRDTKEYMAEYRRRNADKLKEQQAERTKRRAERRRAKTALVKAEKKAVVSDGLRECLKCGERKALDQYKRIGIHGHTKTCMACNPRKVAVKKELPQFVKVKEAPKQSAFRETYTEKLIKEGWRKVGSVSDPQEYVSCYIRGWIVMYLRGQVGSYSTGKCRFGILFDDSGKSYLTLSKAEAGARKMYA